MKSDGRPLIAFAIPELAAGGPDRVVFELLQALPRNRFRVALIVQRAGGRYFDRLPSDVLVRVLSSQRRYPILALGRAVRELGPDILLTTLRMNLTAGLARPLMPGVRLVARQANAIAIDFAALKQTSFVKHRVAEKLIGFALRRADALVAQSHDMAQELRQEAGRNQRIVTIGNPVSVEEIAGAATAQATERLPGSPAIVAVGRLMPQKGFDLLVAAMSRLVVAHPRAHLTILGEGPDRAALEAAIACAGLARAISLPGQSDAVLGQVRTADLVVSSSRYEGFSNAILEAMALGRVVTATDCPGATSEMIVHGESGFLCASEDADALATGMREALGADGARVGARAIAQVRANYDRSIIVERYAALFDELLPIAAARRSGSPKKRASLTSTDSTS